MQKLILRDEFNNRDIFSIIFHHLRILDYSSKHGGYNAIKLNVQNNGLICTGHIFLFVLEDEKELLAELLICIDFARIRLFICFLIKRRLAYFVVKDWSPKKSKKRWWPVQVCPCFQMLDFYTIIFQNCLISLDYNGSISPQIELQPKGSCLQLSKT